MYEQHKQLGIGLHNYLDVHKVFPPTRIGCGLTNWENGQTSFLVSLLPFCEQPAIYDTIIAAVTTGTDGGAQWPNYNNAIYQNVTINYLRCPSEPNPILNTSFIQTTSYGGVYGDNVSQTGGYSYTFRGFCGGGCGCTRVVGINGGELYYGRYYCRDTSSITDGTSNTLAMSEIRNGINKSNEIKGGIIYNASIGAPSTCTGKVSTTDPTVFQTGYSYSDRRGQYWTLARPLYQTITTVLPPNAPTCLTYTTLNGSETGYYPPSSYHSGGVNTLSADGSVKFVSDTVSVDGLSSASNWDNANFVGPSPYGVWGAMGSINGGESVSL